MNDFNNILKKAKELENKMRESQENIKKIRVEGISGTNSAKITLDGEGEIQKLEISDELLKEDKSVIEDLLKESEEVKSEITQLQVNALNKLNLLVKENHRDEKVGFSSRLIYRDEKATFSSRRKTHIFIATKNLHFHR